MGRPLARISARGATMLEHRPPFITALAAASDGRLGPGRAAR